MKLLLALVVAMLAVGACTLLDEGPPDDACRDDSECFRAQGEVCHPTKKRCELKVFMDAGIDAP